MVVLGDGVEEDLAVEKEFCGERFGGRGAVAVVEGEICALRGYGSRELAEGGCCNVCCAKLVSTMLLFESVLRQG